jgi:hypothetical protein
VLVAATATLFHSSGRINSTATNTGPATVASASAEDMSPTFANYQNAANRSFDQLDSLLTRQAREGGPTAQIYTASTMALQGPL